MKMPKIKNWNSPFVFFESDSLSQHGEELVQGRRRRRVAEQLLLGGLAVSLVQHAELERGHQHVLVVGGDELGRPRTQDRREPVRRNFLVQHLQHRTKKLPSSVCARNRKIQNHFTSHILHVYLDSLKYLRGTKEFLEANI